MNIKQKHKNLLILFLTLTFIILTIMLIFKDFLFKKKAIPNAKENKNAQEKVNDNSFAFVVDEKITSLNPFVLSKNKNSSQKAILKLFKRDFFKEKIDWEEMIKEKKAANKNDYSWIQKNPHNIKLKFDSDLANKIILNNQNTAVPLNNYNDYESSKKQTTQSITLILNENLLFENGEKINSDTVLKTLKKYIQKKMDFFDFRDNDFFQKKSNLEFTLNFKHEMTLYEIIKNLNLITLLPNTYFLNPDSYGTQNNPILSYGPYKIGKIDNYEDLILEKNNNYSSDSEEYKADKIKIEQLNNDLEIEAKNQQKLKLFQDKKISFIEPYRLNGYAFNQTTIKEYLEDKNNFNNVLSYPTAPFVFLSFVDPSFKSSDKIDFKQKLFKTLQQNKEEFEKESFPHAYTDLFSSDLLKESNSNVFYNENENNLQRFKQYQQNMKTNSESLSLEGVKEFNLYTTKEHENIALYLKKTLEKLVNQNDFVVNIFVNSSNPDGAFQATISSFSDVKMNQHIKNLKFKLKEVTSENLDNMDLQQIEKTCYEKLPIIPLANEKKVTIFQNIKRDLNHYFLLFGFQ
ncbi:ABC transporter substrate-binding protein [Candidatus Phytoplasma pruni]|uniref:Solute-binding protein family 5 domain-containing protein n=1 Tax=Candidatus Phytoplasma pruni TaxID=479893 RepID=A0A851HH86_9MOLU|nr:ABC transporter substrate-binding protein [Candidatus Phytoplasma pruni]NWN45644.1 hypothetical protein [Candidatus Phytoplasma pruni]